MNFSLTECKTWCVFYSGDICLTTASTVDCLEFPQPGFEADCTPNNLQNEDELWRDVGTVKKTLGLIFNAGSHGISLQQEGFGQCYHQCLQAFTEPQLHAMLELMQTHVHGDFATLGLQLVQQSAIRRGFDVQQSCSAASSASGMAFKD